METESITFEALGGRKFRFDGKMHDPKTLIVWEHELKDIDKLIIKLEEFNDK